MISNEDIEANIELFEHPFNDSKNEEYREQMKQHFAEVAGDDGKAGWNEVFAMCHYQQRLPKYS